MSENEEKAFIFVGEVLALDLINTEKMVRGKHQDLLQQPDDLKQWWSEVSQHHSMTHHLASTEGFDQTTVEEVKALRDQLRVALLKIIEGPAPQQADFQFLNDVLGRVHPRVTWSAERAGHVQYQHEGVPQIISDVALSALHLLTDLDLSRLRRCHNHRCILLFYDTTKSGTRQWCSTACLERERSLRRYEERKRSADGE